MVKAGGDMIALHWEMDATPQRVYVAEAETRQLLGGPDADLKAEGTGGVRDVLVQAGRVVTDSIDEPILVSPVLMGDQVSGTMLEALMVQLEFCGLDLQQLSRAFNSVIVHLGVDGAASCALVLDYLQHTVPANVIVVRGDCQMHSLNRITMDHVMKSGFDLAAMFSLSKLMHISSYFDTFF